MEKILYIAAPMNIASGGPELLHQLCSKLNKLGYTARMFYFSRGIGEGENEAQPVHDNYKLYGNPYTTDIREVEETGSYLVIPEGAVGLVTCIEKCKGIIWWLSVDNYINYIRTTEEYKQSGELDAYGLRKQNMLHFVQSYYAMDFVEQKIGIGRQSIYYLSDYLRKDFSENPVQAKKENYCLFNPAKGIAETLQLIMAAPDIRFLPLQNMTPGEVADLMSRSKVYVDFGNHPGKDRMPREAARKGCCIITNRKGSAGYSKDVPIPESYKFDSAHKDREQITALIRRIFQDYETYSHDFDGYREWIDQEEAVFEQQVYEIFSTIL